MITDMCFICGDRVTHLHERHHIVPRRLNGSDKEENIVQLCPGCHRALERLYDTTFYERLSDSLRLGFSLNDRGKWVTAMEADKRVVEEMPVLTDDPNPDEFEDMSVEEKCVFLYHNHNQIDTEELNARLNTLYRMQCRRVERDEMSLEERVRALAVSR